MILILQIKSLLFSFIYGMFFSFTFFINKKLLLSKNIIFKIIINILFIVDHVLIYFLLIKIINNSILHIYMFFTFLLGIIFYLYYFTLNKKIKLTNKKNWHILKLEWEVYNLKRKKVQRKIVFVFLIYIVLGTLLLNTVIGASYQLYTKSKEKRKYEAELAELKDKEDELKGQVNKLQDPDYIARYAREKYLYSKDGEIIIRIPE